MNARTTFFRSAAALVLAVLAAACGGRGAPSEASGPLLQPAQPAVAASLSGKIAYDGPAPQPPIISMDSDPACEADASASEAASVDIDPSGGLKNVVVWIQEGLPAGHYAPPSTTVTLDQNGCVYRPRVVALMVGQELEILNHDATTHNVHLSAQQNRQWNRSQFAGAIPIRETFDREEVAIPVGCNVHPWMKAWIAVVRHPFFAVSSADGAFRIEGIPPGEYTLGAWHEKLGTLQQRVTLAEHAAATADFTFRPSGRA